MERAMTDYLNTLSRLDGVELRQDEGGPSISPASRGALAQTLAICAEAGARPWLPGIGPVADGPALSLERLDRLGLLDTGSLLARVESGVRWSTLDRTAREAGFALPVTPLDHPEASALEVASERVPLLTTFPMTERRDWLRDLLLLTPAGQRMEGPFSPRRATGPELRTPALSFGAGYAVPVELAFLLLPAHERGGYELAPSRASVVVGNLRGLSDSDGDLWITALARLRPEGNRLRVSWRTSGRRRPRMSIPAAAADGTAPPASSAAMTRLALPWTELDERWGLAADDALACGAVQEIRLRNPGRAALTLDIYGVTERAALVELGLLPEARARTVAQLEALAGRLVDPPNGGPS
jgi:hypothetical protein